jgi:predicted amidohydrolase
MVRREILMKKAVYAIAQIQSFRENFDKNLDNHLRYIREAAGQNAGFILFPELSLIGYERELAKNQSLEADDVRLNVLKEAAAEYQMVISVGGPLRIGNTIFIASWVFTPEGKREIYIKKFLHPGEELFFESREDYDPMLMHQGEKIAFAICFDIENDEHIRKAVRRKATIYTASIAYSENGIQHGLQRLQQLAVQYQIPVLMSNYCGTCGDMKTGGCSSIWSGSGELIASADGQTPSLLIAEHTGDSWRGQVVKF